MSLAGVTCGCRSLFEAVTIPDRTFAREVGHFEILRQFQRIHGASILAESTEHAPRSVIRKVSQHFPSRGIVALPAHHNQVFRACQRAQIAANTKRLARFWIIIQPRRTAIPLRHHRPLQRILLRHNIFRMLRPEGDRKALQEIDLKQLPQELSHAPSLFPPSPIVKQRLLCFSLRSLRLSVGSVSYVSACYSLSSNGN